MTIQENTTRSNKKPQVSIEMRELIIQQWLQGISVSAISKNLGIKHYNISRILKHYKETGETTPRKRGGDTRSKLTTNQKIDIISWVYSDPQIKLRTLANYVYEEWGITVSISTVDRCLRQFHYTVKDVVRVPIRRNSESTLECREEYVRSFRNLELEYEDKNLVFLDEVGFSVVSKTRKGRSLVGTTPFVDVAAVRSRNISVFAAMNKYGMVFHNISNAPFNGETFKENLQILHAKCIESGIKPYIYSRQR